jgi:hypothetical protein
MFTQGFGEVITDMLTVNPELSKLTAASSILDASNYTFQAVTYGKDAQGYNYHGHTVSSIQYVDGDPNNDVSGYNDGFIIVKNYVDNPAFGVGASSYEVSAVNRALDVMKIMPNYPHNHDTRLERSSTVTTNISDYSATPYDLGHYLNAITDPALSSVWNVVGGFPPAGNTSKYYVFSGTEDNPQFAVSGNLSGVYNEFGLVDKYGYVTINPNGPLDSGLSSTTNEQGSDLSAGVCVFSSTGNAPSDATVSLAVVPQKGDAASLLLFGGCNHIGIYCLDINGMLSSGITPPYSWDSLNNNRKYKLIGKVTFLDNLFTSIAGSVGGSLNNGVDALANNSILPNKGPLVSLRFNFL